MEKMSKELKKELENENSSLVKLIKDSPYYELECIRQSIENENVSYGELARLQQLTDYIDGGDTLLLEWAGVPESNE